MNGLSVIIPSKNATNINACVDAVGKNDPVHQVIVIDDGLDRSKLNIRPDEAFCCGHKPVEFYYGEKPFIFARNCNIGIREAGNDDVILLNDDALLKSPGGFALLQNAAEEHQEYGIIGAVTNVTGAIQQRPGRVGLREVPEIAFVCVLIPRRTIAAVGMLDERYCIDYGVEDKDYCTAVKKAGMKVGVHDGCFVDHGSLRSSFRGDPHAPGSYLKNFALYKQKWGLPA